MVDHVKPALQDDKPDHIILPPGTNDLHTEETTSQTAESIMGLTTSLKNNGNLVIVSGIIPRFDNLIYASTTKQMKLTNTSQPVFTCSKLKIETLEQRCEICSKLTIKPPKRFQWHRFDGFIVNFEHISHLCSSVSIVNFEHVIAGWVSANVRQNKYSIQFIQ